MGAQFSAFPPSHESPSAQAAPPQLFSLAVVRPDDLLALVFHLVNINIEDSPTAPPDGKSSRKRLVAANPQQAYIIVEFPAQSVGEQSFFEVSDPTANPPEPKPQPDPKRPVSRGEEDPTIAAIARYSGPSWLVFQIPPEKLPIAFELKALLQLCMEAPQVVQTQIGDPVAPEQMLIPHPAFGNQDCEYALPSGTAIEAPFRLYLSPTEGASWLHPTTPEMTASDGTKTQDATQSHRSVLWHTRLQGAEGWQFIHHGGFTSASDQVKHGIQPPQARAVWSPDRPMVRAPLARPDLPPNLHFSLEPGDRAQLVRLTTPPPAATGAFMMATPSDSYSYPPIDIEQLFLSTMGAWLKAHWDIGSDTPPNGLDIIHWDHELSMGRDQFVRVVKAGYLLPFGHPAVLITITQRKFQQEHDKPHETAAFLRTHQFIVVTHPVKTYASSTFPFQQVTAKTLVTPNILQGTLGANGQFTSDGLATGFWVEVPDPTSGQITDFQFHLEAADQDGGITEFTAPLVFVEKTLTDDQNQRKAAIQAYESDSLRRQTVSSFGGAAISFVPARSDGVGDGRLETQDITFGADQIKTDGSLADAPFQPALRYATVTNPAVKRMTGSAKGVTVTWEDKFVHQGGNAGDVYFRQATPDLSTALSFADTTRSGGLLAPNLPINGFSRLLGPVALPLPGAANQASLVDGTFSPATLLRGLGLNLLGAIDLSTIFLDVLPQDLVNQAQKLAQEGQKLAQQAQDAAQQAQNISQQLQDAAANPSETVPALIGDVNTTRFTWETSHIIPSVGPFNSNNAHFRLDAVIFHPPTGSPAFSTKGTLEGFEIDLPSSKPDEVLVAIPFKSFRFAARSGQKLDVSVDMDKIQFKNDLSFIQTLLDIIPLDGFVDPPYLDVETDHVSTGFNLAVPTIAMGYFTLQNVSFSAALYLPFLGGEAALDLEFCTRDKPFMLTVSLLGGGGYFGMKAGIGGIQMVELSLDFGASVALDLGVASGSLSVVGGVYFQLATNAPATLTAFVRASGELDVLGLITVSACLYIGLTYQDPTLSGDAEMDVSISIAFFSETVSIHMHREFKGSDPTFLDTHSAADWQEYCDAFAS